MDFTFSIPQNIVFGSGSLSRLPELAKKLEKKKALIISGPHLNKIGMVQKCYDSLSDAGIESESFTETEANPSTTTVEKASKVFKKSGADFIVAFGGGSPLDVAKAVSVVCTYGGKITDYEGAGKIPGSVIPMIAIPTTAGTGSEVTSFSVITDHSQNYKLTVSSNFLLPAFAILDPDLIQTVPKNTAAACGVDAMVHALEAYISKASSPFSDMFALKSLELIGENLFSYVQDRSDKTASEGMLLASLFAGIAFSHARLGDVHAMSHPVSAYFDVPHGVANAILLPTVVDFNASADDGKYFEIYKRLKPTPIEKSSFTPKMLSDELQMLNENLGIPKHLLDVGVRPELFGAMAEDAMKSGNIKVNPRTTMKEDIIEMYKKTF